MLHASTGITIVVFICTLSFGHIRLAFLKIAGWQLNLIVIPASVSWGFTWWMYTRASRSSFSLGGADALVRSSEFLLLKRPAESAIMRSLAVSKSLRFIARTMLSLSSRVPAPTYELEVDGGPHCVGALLALRPCVPDCGFRLLVPGFVCVLSPPSTFVASPWIADHEFPQMPDNAVEASRPAFEVCALADRTKDEGLEVALGRHERGLGLGDTFREPLSLAEEEVG